MEVRLYLSSVDPRPAVLGAAPVSRTPAGKPFLEGSAVRFSVSHSGGWYLLAVTEGVEIGVDIEQIRPELANADTARLGLSPEEFERWQSLAEEARVGEFFRLWTRKEALLKAQGVGLPGGPPSAEGYTVETVEAPEGYAAAVAYAGPPRRSILSGTRSAKS